jgi:glycosyltransferase involved in cell wall biosynthesis
MDKVAVSVAMCTYNGSRYVREQLESIAAQTSLPDELIICDDRSTDGMPEILERFKQRVPFPVHVEVNQENRGSTKTFERAIGLCRGEIIALADQDDVWHSNKLSCMLEVFGRGNGIGAVFSDAQLIDQDSRPLSKSLWSSFVFTPREQDTFEDGQGLKVMLKHTLVTGATMAFRSKFRDLIFPIPPNQIHDLWIALLIASVSHLALIRRPVMQYRRHEGQQIGPGPEFTFWQKLPRRVGPDFYFREIEQLNEVCERLYDHRAAFRPHSYALPLMRAKIRHRNTRARFPSSKILRLALVIREVATLRYWQYSNGLGSVAKDLLV